MKTLVLFILIASNKITIPIETPISKIEQTRITAEDFGVLLIPGKPILPAKTVLVAIPPGSEIISVKVKEKKLERVDTVLIPVYETTNTDSFYIERSNEMSLLYPEDAGREIGRLVFRNYNLVKIMITPFAYHLSKQILYERKGIEIEIKVKSQKSKVKSQIIDTTMDNIIKDYVINFDDTRKWYEIEKREEKFDYLLVIPEEYKAKAKRFISWKQSIGHRMKIVNPDELDLIKEKHIDWGVKYMLFVGTEIAPAYYFEDIEIGQISPSINAFENIITFEMGTELWKKSMLLISDNNTKYLSEKIIENIGIDWRLKKVYSWQEARKELQSAQYGIVNLTNRISHIPYPISDISPSIVFSLYPFEETPPIPSISPIRDQGEARLVVFPTSKWTDVLCGGAYSFNYFFLLYLIQREMSIGDALLRARLDYEKYFPMSPVPDFRIYGDPSLRLSGILSFDVKVSTNMNNYFAPNNTLMPSCIIKNQGTQTVEDLKVYCNIDSSNVSIYSHCLLRKSLIPGKEELIEFPEWNIGQGEYRINFRVFNPKDENSENDTTSIIITPATGDYLLFDPLGEEMFLDSLLKQAGYKGIYSTELSILYPYLRNFSSIFATSFNCDEEVDSILHCQCLYFQGKSIPEVASFAGIEVVEELSFPENVIGVSNTLTEDLQFGYEGVLPFKIIENGATIAFQEIGAYYLKDDYKIFTMVSSFKDIKESVHGADKIALIDTIMHFLGIASRIPELDTSKQENNIESLFALPNPFRNKTVISFELKKEQEVGIAIYDLAGKTVSILLNQTLIPGFYEIVWDGKDSDGKLCVNGIYFMRVKNGHKYKTAKLILLK